MTFFFAQLDAVPDSALKNFALIVAGLLAAVYYGKEIFFGNKKTTEITPQPLTVEVVKALHEQFADKREFEEHISHNTDRHGQLFASINRVEREAREALDKKFATLNAERTENIKHLNEQFTFIRENVAAINRELQIRSK